MPRPNLPGVYVREVQGAPPAVTGAPTAVTAFVGRARRGPVDRPVRVTSAAEFERTFGAAWEASWLAPAVAAYFANGGAEARVVRAVHGPPGGPVGARPAAVELGDAGELRLEASSPGDWGDALRVSLLQHPAAAGGSRFDLHLVDTATAEQESFADLSADPSDLRYATAVLAAESRLARVAALSGVPTGGDRTGAPFSGGSDGPAPLPSDVVGSPRDRRGLHALERDDRCDLVCVPPLLDDDGAEVEMLPVHARAADFCGRRRAMLLVDPPAAWAAPADALAGVTRLRAALGRPEDVAVYWPRVRAADPFAPPGGGALREVPPAGAVAGVVARTDRTRGVWKAPAGAAATLAGVAGMAFDLDDAGQEPLNSAGVNALRDMPTLGPLVWGARTLATPPSDWTYVPARRLALHLEESLARGLRWVVFEPNAEPLWARVRQAVDGFLDGLWRAGALQGATRDQAWFVRCGADTTTPADVSRGTLNVELGIAPVRPAEFVRLRLRFRMPV